MTTSKKFPDVRDLAEEFNCNPSTIWRRVADGTLPKPFKIGGLTRWVPEEIDAGAREGVGVGKGGGLGGRRLI